MEKTGKAATAGIVTVILAIIGVFASGGEFLNFDIGDTITTNIDSHDVITTIIQEALDVDLDEFRTMCNNGEVDETFVKYCDILN